MSNSDRDAMRDTGPDWFGDDDAAAQLAEELVAAITADRPREQTLHLATQLQRTLSRSDESPEEYGFEGQPDGTIVDAVRSAALKLVNALPRELRHSAAVDVRTLPLVELALRLPGIASQIAKQAEAASGSNPAQLAHVLTQITRELRGPIHEVVDQLARLSASDLTLEQRERIESVEECAEAIVHLANDLSDLTQLQAGRFATARLEFRVRDCVAAALHTVQPRARSRGVQIRHAVSADVPAVIRGDPGRLRHVLSTLVGNAVSAKTNGTVLVSVTAGDIDEDSLDLRATIQSVGSDKRRRSSERTGAALWRGSSSSGLGLSIARQLVAQMGGRTWVETVTGGGSALNFTIRPGLVRADRETLSSPSRTTLRGLRALVIEPHSGDAGTVTASLRRFDVEPVLVRTAADAQTALREARNSGRPFGVGLICAALDDRVGRAAAEAIAALDASQRPPLALLTPNGQRGDATHCRRVGITAYLPQPLSDQDLRDTLTTLCDSDLVQRIRRRGLLTRHFLRELRGRLHVVIAAATEELTTTADATVAAVGHRTSTLLIGDGLPDDLGEDPPNLIVLVAAELPDNTAVWLDQVQRRFGLLGAGRLPVLALTRGSEGTLQDRLTSRLSATVPNDAEPETVAIAIAELATSNSNMNASGAAARHRLVDADALLRRLGGDADLVSEVIGLFLRDQPQMSEAVQSAVHRADGDALLRSSDTLKGTFEIFGVRAGIDLCTRLSRSGRADDFSEVAKLVERLETLTAALRNELAGEGAVRAAQR